MKDTDIQTLEKKLREEQALLRAELSKMGAPDPNNPDDWTVKKAGDESFGSDRNDNADIDEMEGEDTASINELEARLKEVERALDKVDSGTYGVCEISGDDIEMDRLVANPAARTCKKHMHEAR